MPRTKVGSLRPEGWTLTIWKGPAGRSGNEAVWLELEPPTGDPVEIGYLHDAPFKANMARLLESKEPFDFPIEVYGGKVYATIGPVDGAGIEIHAALNGTTPGVVFSGDDFWTAYEIA